MPPHNFMWFPATEAAILATTPGIASRVGFATDTHRIFLDNGTAWIGMNLVFKGVWSSASTYSPLDIVTYGGSAWLALTASTNVTPVEGTYWTILAAKGDPGPTPPDASTTAKGVGKVSVAPVDAANPVFVGDNDTRNSNTRTPTDGTVTDAKVASGAAIAESKLNLASDAAAGTASRRTLGTGALQAAGGADGRLSDTRTPTDGTVTDAKVASGAAIAESKLNLASDAAAGTASRRTLGAGAQQASPGNHVHAAADVTSGQFPIARLASGAPDGTKFVADDGTLKTPAAAAVARVYKSADETVNNTATLQNDDQLLFSIAASETWAFKFVLFYNGGATTDFKVGITTPTGTTRLIWAGLGLSLGAAAMGAMNQMAPVTASGGNASFGAIGAGVPAMMIIEGTVLNGTTAGTVQLQWAQDVANVTNTVLQAGSYLDARKLS